MGQFFCGTTTLVCDVYGMKTEKQFPNTLEDNIRERGAPQRLLSDHAAVETSARVKDILRLLHIGDWQSEAYMQHQNFAERCWQDVKRITNTILDRSSSPENTWLLAVQYVCFILNHLATPSLSHKVPLQLLTGSTVDISAILRFVWYEPVYFQAVEPHFPSDSLEDHDFFVGFAHNVGHTLTYRILTRDTQTIIERSAMNPADPNLRLDIFDGETAREFIKSKQDEKLKLIESSNQDGDLGPGKTTWRDTESTPTTGSSDDDNTEDPTFQKVTPENLKPKDLVGRTILLDQDDDTKLRAKILKFVSDTKGRHKELKVTEIPHIHG
jgi:hypothetical protein